MKTLRQLRNEYGISQRDLATAFEVSDRTIYNVEKNSSNIGDKLLSKYMKAFNLSYDDIFLGDEYEIFEFEEDSRKRVLQAHV